MANPLDLCHRGSMLSIKTILHSGDFSNISNARLIVGMRAVYCSFYRSSYNSKPIWRQYQYPASLYY